jgi:hypothetical protein
MKPNAIPVLDFGSQCHCNSVAFLYIIESYYHTNKILFARNVDIQIIAKGLFESFANASSTRKLKLPSALPSPTYLDP